MMITEERIPANKQIEFVCIDQIVPKDHLVRKLDKAIDFTFIYDLAKDLYSDVGRTSIDPVILFKILFIKYIFGIRSMRRTIDKIKAKNAYKWFLGYGFFTKVPHHSTFRKNYIRHFEGTDVFEKIFENVLNQAREKGFLDTEAVFWDATHIKASANKGKMMKKKITKKVESFRNNLGEEINDVHASYGQKPFLKKEKTKERTSELPPLSLKLRSGGF